MPVFPPFVEPFTIRPPTTTNDEGKPGPSLSKDVERVFRLIDDERHLTAQELLVSVQERLAEREQHLPKSKKPHLFPSRKARKTEAARHEDEAEIEHVKSYLVSRESQIEKLQVRLQR